MWTHQLLVHKKQKLGETRQNIGCATALPVYPAHLISWDMIRVMTNKNYTIKITASLI